MGPFPFWQENLKFWMCSQVTSAPWTLIIPRKPNPKPPRAGILQAKSLPSLFPKRNCNEGAPPDIFGSGKFPLPCGKTEGTITNSSLRSWEISFPGNGFALRPAGNKRNYWEIPNVCLATLPNNSGHSFQTLGKAKQPTRKQQKE